MSTDKKTWDSAQEHEAGYSMPKQRNVLDKKPSND